MFRSRGTFPSSRSISPWPTAPFCPNSIAARLAGIADSLNIARRGGRDTMYAPPSEYCIAHGRRTGDGPGVRRENCIKSQRFGLSMRSVQGALSPHAASWTHLLRACIQYLGRTIRQSREQVGVGAISMPKISRAAVDRGLRNRATPQRTSTAEMLYLRGFRYAGPHMTNPSRIA